MNLIPALDLIDGGVVRLAQGDYGRRTDYGDDAIERALAYQRAGARRLHVVDLDSAKGGGQANLALIASLCEALTIPVQTGGGVRSADDIEARLKAGAERVVVGSVCIQALAQFGADVLVAGLDVKKDADQHPPRWIPRASGWLEPGALDLYRLLDLLMPSGLVHVLCTDIDRDGLLMGPAVDLYRDLVDRYPTLRVQASGGIGSSDDLETTQATGVDACIVGRALLEGQVSIDEIGRYPGVDGGAS
jgi:phosphoribosylformimino-5-aminoimidazole carboxamide ribotide isomerase